MSYRCAPIPLGVPLPFQRPFLANLSNDGCPINLTNLCRMRAKCQQTKSQVSKRPHNLTPSGSTSLRLHLEQLLGSLPERMLCAYQTLRSKWKTPKCKTQNVNANMKAKANADSCAIQSCCSCQVASSSSSSSLSLWHLSIYLIVDFCRTSTNDFLAKFVFRAQFMRLVCHSAVAVRERQDHNSA